ncbi:MAG TPA: hypothetical protein VFO06_10865 [Gemmatimonadales bacterium]|nr:hypothetical protein [Gemmatimonadales bacterium]
MTFKGRHWVVIWLAGFLAVATIVQLRQSSAFRSARAVALLRQQRTTLESQLAELERRIREASSRQVLGTKAERDLEMHFPADSEQALLPLAEPPGAGSR